MLLENQVPSHLAVSRLCQALGRSGNVEEIGQVEALLKELGTTNFLSSMVFVNNVVLAHIRK